jgi:hypothetical protein
MFDLKQKLLVVVMGCLLLVGMPLGAYAQKQGGDKRPPKDDNKVVVQPKGEKPPPPRNNNQGQGDKRGDKRGRP